MAKHKADSQVSLILGHLQSGKDITPLEAISLYGCYRLGAVIFKLKKEGYNIVSQIKRYVKDTGGRGSYAVYRLEANNVSA